MKKDKTALWFFLIGLGAYTQVFVLGCIGISELVMFLVTPLLLYRDYRLLKHDGFIVTIWLVVFTMLGCATSTVYNGNPVMGTLKVEAQFYSIISILVVFHHLLRKDASGFKWLFLGLFLSDVITIFVLHPQLQADAAGVTLLDQSVDEIMEGAMFWMRRLRSLMDVFVSGFYFQVPIPFGIVMVVFYVVFLAKTTITGRSASAMVVAGILLVLLVGKKRSRMRKFSRYFIACLILGVFAMFGLKILYKEAALSGFMGEAALAKYEAQTLEGDSFFQMLMSGRKEFFIGLTAAIDKPIMGYGFPPIDREGYGERFIYKYGNQVERQAMARRKIMYAVGIIPSHSYIIGAWLRCGIIGLIFWGHVILLCINHFRRYLAVIPQWCGYFSFAIPTFLWNAFFSPFNERVTTPILICCLLFARAVAKGKIYLPYKMEMEAQEHDR